jgi:hypothetical protein
MSQRLEALQIANTARLEIARVKHEVAALDRRASALHAATLLRDGDSPAGVVGMEALLLAVRRSGPRVVGAILSDARIPHGARARRVREFTQRQRNLIADLLERWAAGELVAGLR